MFEERLAGTLGDMLEDTLGALLKYQDDIARLDDSKVKVMLDEVKAELRAAE